MRANSSFTRVTCAGIVDADAYDATDAAFLKSRGIAILPVSEIENLVLLPDVIESIASIEGYRGEQLISKCNEIQDAVLSHAADGKNQLSSIMRYCRRRINRGLKRIDLSSCADVESLATNYALATREIDVDALSQVVSTAISAAIARNDVTLLLQWYDNKGILSIAAKAKNTTQQNFAQWLVRALRNGTAPAVSEALRRHLPPLQAI